MTLNQKNLTKSDSMSVGSRSITAAHYVPYTQDDYDFISEITEATKPVSYKPSKWLLTLIGSLKGLASIKHGYFFPWSELIKSTSQVELTESLEEVIQKMREEVFGYFRHRETYCMLSLAMNRLGLQAPAFRQQPAFPQRKGGEWPPEYLLIQRDRVVIDCHWLFCTKSKVYAQESKWRGIVNPKLKLQTQRIEEFACTMLTNEYRADSIFNLTEFQQAQMAALKGQEMNQRFRGLGEMVTNSAGKRTVARFKKIDRAIREWSISQPRFEKHYPKYRALALASELLEEPTQTRLAMLVGLILGEAPLSNSTIQQSRAVLDRLITKI